MSQATCAGSHRPQSLGRMTTSQGVRASLAVTIRKKYPGPHVITRPGVPRQGYCAGSSALHDTFTSPQAISRQNA